MMSLRHVMRRVNFYYDILHHLHSDNGIHPESTLRVENIRKHIIECFGKLVSFYDTGSIKDHPKLLESPKWSMLTGDTYASKYTPLVLDVTRQLISLAVKNLLDTKYCEFILCRPPGHHASKNIQHGFCFQNNAWYAVENLVANGIRNICIYDMDAHHGDGTERCVRSATEKEYSRVRFVSTHAFGTDIFPGTGEESCDEKVLNLPLRRYCSDSSFLRVFRNDVLPFIGNPEVLIVSAGYDTHKDDPMKLMNLTTNTYNTIGKSLKNLNCPILFILEGGYNIDILGKCVEETIKPWVV